MRETLVHRGPDGSGQHVAGSAGIAMRRLAIMDLDTGDQPIFNETGEVSCVVNGEIYNFRDLREDLKAKGHTFRTGSDAEVVVHLWEEEGPALAERLRGMYAVAVHDARTNSLFLLRDRIGIKPLYVSRESDRVLFGSEMKALLAVPDLDRTLSAKAAVDFFTWRCTVGEDSALERVGKLLPGHWMLCEPGKEPVVRRYWALEPVGEGDLERDPDRAVSGLRDLVDECVDMRLMSDVPLGAFLSGGIDSTVVVSSMTRSGGQPQTCCVGFDERAHDEREYASVVSAALGTDHRETVLRPDPDTVLDFLPWHYDEPFADASAMPTSLVSSFARERVTVALSGDGGDELFAGYTRYKAALSEESFRSRVPAGLRRGVLSRIAARWPHGSRLPRPLRARFTLWNLAQGDPLRAYARTVAMEDPADAWRTFSADLWHQLGGYDPLDRARDLVRGWERMPLLCQLEAFDIQQYLVDDILTKVDRASMAASLEVRVPLLDHVLVEWAMRLHPDLKIRGGQSKWALRRIAEPDVPRGFFDRPKHGFDVPLEAWLRGPLSGPLETAVRRADPALFHVEHLESRWRLFLEGSQRTPEYFWAFLMFDAWRERHSL